MISKLKRAWRYFKLAWKGEPIRTWRKLENGKYVCDGDCGRYRLHGVCTCGLCHFFAYEGGRYHKIQRSKVSWRREGDTEQHMMHIPYVKHCDHGNHLDNDPQCKQCLQDCQNLMKLLSEPFEQ